jgi:GGDEF domain-containing protein
MMMDWLGRVLDRVGVSSGWSLDASDVNSNGIVTPSSTIVDSDELASELARARRYEHSLAIVVLSAQPVSMSTADSQDAKAGSKLPQMVALMTAMALRETLRHSDVVCYQAAENRFVLGLPESNADDAAQAMDRIRGHFLRRLSVKVDAGIAVFPRDALTLDELVATGAAGATLAELIRPPRTNGNAHSGRSGSRRHTRRLSADGASRRGRP